MRIGLDLCFVVLCERTTTRLYFNPSILFSTKLTLLTLTSMAYNMPTLIRPDFLSTDLFVTYSTTIILF